MFECGLIGHDVVARRMQDSLAGFIGRGRQFSVEFAAAAADIKARTLKSYCEGAATPGLHAFLSLAATMPLPWTNHVLALAGLRAERVADEADAGEVMKVVAKLNLAIVDAMADGKISHVERRTLPGILRESASQQAAWAKQLENGGT